MTSFQKLLQAVPDALVGMDQKGLIQFVNRQTESLFGYDRDELVGQHITALVPEYLWEIYSEHREDYFADPRARSTGLDLELVGRHADSTELPINISFSHVDTGDVLLVITAVRDVTQQQQAVRNAELIAAIVEYSDDVIIGGSLEGIITSWNLAARRMYGYSGKEIVGRPGSLLTPADRAADFKAMLAKAKAGEHVEDFQTSCVRKDGTVIPVLLTISPIRDGHGAVVGLSEVHRDLSEHNDAARYTRSLIEAAVDPLVTISPKGVITDANEAMVLATGLPRRSLIGTDFAACFTDSDKANRLYRLVFHHGLAVDYDLTMRHKDGTQTDVRFNASAYRDAAGAVLGVFGSARDVTKQMQANREDAEERAGLLERLAELERFQRLVVGHELTTIELKEEIERRSQARPGR